MALLHCLQPLQMLSRGTLWGEETQPCPDCSERHSPALTALKSEIFGLTPNQDKQLGLAQEFHDEEGRKE